MQDTAYPPLLFQILEDCWQQEHYLRPSAEQLCATIKQLTGLSMEENQPATPAEGGSILLDSFTLHQENRISAAHCRDSQAGVELCAAVGGQDGLTDVVSVHYDPQSDQSEMLFNVSTT